MSGHSLVIFKLKKIRITVFMKNTEVLKCMYPITLPTLRRLLMASDAKT